jgi:hypothetical protein
VLGNCAFYLHLGSFAQFLIADLDRKIQAIDDEATRQPQLRKVAQPARAPLDEADHIDMIRSSQTLGKANRCRCRRT